MAGKSSFIFGVTVSAVLVSLIWLLNVSFNTDPPVLSFDMVSVQGFNSSESLVRITGKVLNPNKNVNFYFSKENHVKVRVKVGTDTYAELFCGSLPAIFVEAQQIVGYQATLSGCNAILSPLEKAWLNQEMMSSKITLKFASKLWVKPSVCYLPNTWIKTRFVTWKLLCDVVVCSPANIASIGSYSCDDKPWNVFWGK